MTSDELILWTKINDFQLDVPGSQFTFSDRVARENGWTKDYVQRVIQEYKKFIYLCCVSDQGITPSDPVDQVWHLHLTYTRSYWIDFCQDTLGKQIHHNPTRGGSKEARKFNDYYTHLKNIYKIHFDSEPPLDIWQPADVRFSDIDFQRVNLRRNWVIKKPKRKLIAILSLIFIAFFGIAWTRNEKDAIAVTIFLIIMTVIVYFSNKSNRNGGGCSGGGCSGNSGHHSGHSGHDAGHSGCSGCSGSGCSGCGGGGD